MESLHSRYAAGGVARCAREASRVMVGEAPVGAATDPNGEARMWVSLKPRYRNRTVVEPTAAHPGDGVDVPDPLPAAGTPPAEAPAEASGDAELLARRAALPPRRDE